MMPNEGQLKNRLENRAAESSVKVPLAKVAAMPLSAIFQTRLTGANQAENHRASRQFDVAELYRGPVQTDEASRHDVQALDEKLRQAYFWIVNNAVISPALRHRI